MDALNEASQQTYSMLRKKIDSAPSLVESINKEDFINNKNDLKIYKVYGIYEVVLNETTKGLYSIFAVVSADNIIKGYNNDEWRNIKYRGFYTTVQEAKNQIDGYIGN